MRAFLLHRSRFQRNLVDPMLGIAQGALVLYTNGMWYYHDGTMWVPPQGLNAVEWIKMFQCNVPILEDDEFGIMAGLCDDRRPLDDTWDEQKVRECLNSFIAQFKDQYLIWPDGEVMHPLKKSRRLTAMHKDEQTSKKRKVRRGVDESLRSTNRLGTQSRRKALMAKTIPVK